MIDNEADRPLAGVSGLYGEHKPETPTSFLSPLSPTSGERGERKLHLAPSSWCWLRFVNTQAAVTRTDRHVFRLAGLAIDEDHLDGVAAVAERLVEVIEVF